MKKRLDELSEAQQHMFEGLPSKRMSSIDDFLKAVALLLNIYKTINPLTSIGGLLDPSSGFHTYKFKLSSNQNETFSTCSPIMSVCCYVNLMTSFIICAKLIMHIKV